MTIEKPESYNGIFEPESAAKTNKNSAPIYPHNTVLVHDDGGNIIEADATPGRERIRISHGSGSFIEIHPNGDINYKSFKDNYFISVHDTNIVVGGKCNIEVKGDTNIIVHGNKTEYIHGDYELHVGGSMSQTVDGIGSIYSRQDLIIGGGASDSLGGSVTLKTGDNFHIEGDLTVEGDLTAKKITSRTRVDAGYGVSAGVGGFCTVGGGMYIGVASPLAPPDVEGVLRDIPNPLTNLLVVNGPILSIGMEGVIFAETMMCSPLALLESSLSLFHCDLVNTLIYNFHTHGSAAGATSPPVPLMLFSAV